MLNGTGGSKKPQAIVEPTADGYWVVKVTDDRGLHVMKSDKFLRLKDATDFRARLVNSIRQCEYQTRTELADDYCL